MTIRLAAALAIGLLSAPMSALAASSDPAAMPAGVYEIEKHHASVTGKVSHLGLSTYVFRFDRFDASYTYDPKAPAASKLTVSVDATSLNTGFDRADKEFPVEFLGADKQPLITFVSTAISYTGNKGKVTGGLTMNGVTKPAVLDVTFVGYESAGPLANKAGFAASTIVKRSEFGLTKYAGAVGDDITIEINAEFKKKP
ncbi:MAG: hypothetical protein JWO33_1160 [Caulobacteraceae bacterium]|nr:hypothetical protein [Caulobacteraceae bacterium]